MMELHTNITRKRKEETKMNTTTVGLDLAKNVFHIVKLDKNAREVGKKRLTRSQLLTCFANHERCVIAMEACGGAHYFARKLSEQGHEIRLIAPQHVKPYRRGQKNDYNDARAIAEAARVPSMRFVTPKNIVQQDLQALARMRKGALQARTALVNRLRGLLAEYGIVMRQGVNTVRRQLPEILEDAHNELTDVMRHALALEYELLLAYDQHIEALTDRLKAQALQDEAVRRLLKVPGFGALVAAVFVATLGDGLAFKNGREASASVGLVPRQHTSGDKPYLMGITKHGDRYLRSLLVHGARSVVRAAANKDDALSRWINRLREKRGINKATVALANKLTRIGWAVLARQETYQPS